MERSARRGPGSSLAEGKGAFLAFGFMAPANPGNARSDDLGPGR